jgi:hypothetical protein
MVMHRDAMPSSKENRGANVFDSNASLFRIKAKLASTRQGVILGP